MPIEYIASDEMPKTTRKSKIEKSPDWTELIKALGQGFPTGKTIKLTFSDATRKLFKNDDKRVAQAFVLRLRRDYSDRYKVRLIEGQVYISKLEKT